LPGETNATLVIARASSGNAGNYDVVVSNPSGSSTSAVARRFTVILFDFGDAPIRLSNAEGRAMARGTSRAGVFWARHRCGSRRHPSADSLGDDLSGSDDEDGVTVSDATGVSADGHAASGRLDQRPVSAWVDFDRAIPGGAGEQVLANRALSAEPARCSLLFPATASPGITYARFPASARGGLSFTGRQPTGK